MNTTRLMTLIPLFLAVHAVAGVVQIDGAGSYQLNSHEVSDVLQSSSPYLSSDDLAVIHQELNGWGVVTDGKITLVPIETMAGIALFTLVDQELGGGDTGIDASLGIVSTGSSSMQLFINDASQDEWSLVQPPFGSQIMGATFVWGSVGSGDGFAWSEISLGDALSYNFTIADGAMGLDAEAFQFVSWEDGWSVLGTDGWKLDGSQVFTGTVVPTPPIGLIFTAFALKYSRRRNN